MTEGFIVTAELFGVHRKYPEFSLLPGDLIIKDEEEKFTKLAPGLGIFGFELSPAQEATLKSTAFVRRGLEYVTSEV